MYYKEQYDERKKSVLNLLSKTSGFFKSVDDVETEGAFESLYNQVKNGEFTIVVVGEFSAGKSTFLNAMMGDKYLPSFRGETTATVNFLKHKDKSSDNEGLRVTFNDGSVESYPEASFDNVERFSTTRGDEVAQTIKHVDLFLESNFLKNDVTLVDSPGLNGVREGHRQITEEQIKKSHACIFLFNAEQPGKNTDFDFLDRLQDEVSTVLLVLNKIDSINSNEESIESVLEVLTNSYQSKFPGTQTVPEIWPLSAFNALVARSDQQIAEQVYTSEEKPGLLEGSRIEAFEERLWRFLTQGEKAQAELLEPVNRVERLLMKRRQENESSIGELQNTESRGEVLEQILALEAELDGLNEKIATKKRDVKRTLRQSRLSAENTISADIESIRDRALAKFDADFIQDHDRLLADDSLNQTLSRFLNRLDEQIKIKLASAVQSYQLELEGNIQVFIEQEINGMNEAFSELSKSIELSSHNELNQYNFSLDYQALEARRHALEEEVNKLEERLENTEQAEQSALKLALKKESLEKRLESLSDQRKNALFDREDPLVDEIVREKKSTEKRRGLFGFVGNLLIGYKDVTDKYIEKDDSRLKQYQKRTAEIKADYDAEIAKIENELRGVNETDVDSSNTDSKRLRKQLAALEEKKAAETAEFNRQQQRHFKVEMKKLQEEIEEKIDTIRRESSEEMNRRLKEQERSLVPLLMQSIEADLSDKLLRQKEVLELKKCSLEGSIADKEADIVRYQEQNEAIKALLMEVIEVQDELEGIELDTIQQQAISSFEHTEVSSL